LEQRSARSALHTHLRRQLSRCVSARLCSQGRIARRSCFFSLVGWRYRTCRCRNGRRSSPTPRWRKRRSRSPSIANARVRCCDSEPCRKLFQSLSLTYASLDLRQADKPQLVWKVAGRGSVAAQRANEATPCSLKWPCPYRFHWPLRRARLLKQPELSRSLGWRSAPDVETIIAGPIGTLPPARLTRLLRSSYRTNWFTAHRG